MTRLKIATLSLVTGAALLGTVATSVLAAPSSQGTTNVHTLKPAGRIARIGGTIASTNGTSIVVTRKNGKSVTVQTATTTRYLVNGKLAATAPQLTTGERVRIIAQRQPLAASTPPQYVFIARVVMTGTFPRLAVLGTITSSTSTSFTLTMKAGKSVTIALTPTTRYFLNGQKVSGLSALPQTGVVRVLVTRNAGSLTARVVVSGALPGRIRRVAGTLSSATSSQLIITRKSGKTVTIELTPTTKFIVDGKLVTIAPTFAAGSKIVAVVQRQSKGVFVAKAVATGKGSLRLLFPHARGTVAAFDGGTLSVQLKSGKIVSFQVTATTRFVVNGQKVTSAPALNAGQRVLVLGRKTASGQFEARAVIVHTA